MCHIEKIDLTLSSIVTVTLQPFLDVMPLYSNTKGMEHINIRGIVAKIVNAFFIFPGNGWPNPDVFSLKPSVFQGNSKY